MCLEFVVSPEFLSGKILVKNKEIKERKTVRERMLICTEQLLLPDL